MTAFSADDISLFERLVRTRRSVRGFLPDRVPDALMQKIFETARWSPSGTNVQPWHICVASGEVRDQLRAEFLRRAENNIASNPDHPSDGKVGDIWRERKRGCATTMIVNFITALAHNGASIALVPTRTKTGGGGKPN